ncbi:replication protein RepA [Kozakia baliensis]|uniref:replication protein RepA n=1 Tax=Kozakia baliensis TaxID=153496 RepID=UPI00087C0CFB|nr:replication protein RepA [Kozakia baliensis]AOX21699.1 replication protein [Kozakia baliensis]
MKPDVAARKKPSSKRASLGQEIATTPPTGGDMAFLHTTLCQVGLPRSKTSGREYQRRSGSDWLIVRAGSLDMGDGKGPVEQAIPYGAMPRLALAFISTYAKRYKTREVPIGDSAYEFLKLIGTAKDGNMPSKTGYKMLQTQLHALAACHMQLGNGKGLTINTQIAKKFQVWAGNAEQPGLWPGVLTLDIDYYDALLEGGVPLDQRALMALSGSALALDVYCWLAHRLHRIEGRSLLLRWASLRDQFGQDYTGPEADKNFKKKFLPALEKVLEVYPQAKVKRASGTGGGLMFFPSAPPIAKT